MEKRVIKILNMIGENAVSYNSAEILYDNLVSIIDDSYPIELDFNGVKIITSQFFNGSIGRLLGKVSIIDLKNKIKISNLNEFNTNTLNVVIGNALEFYKSD